MAASKAVWGLDIGQCALKAVKLREVQEGQFAVEAFEVIEHSSVLSQPDIDLAAVIQASLNEFMARQDTVDTMVAVSVLGQSSFMRFVKLPPVEKKKIPDIVRFEAEQQIPFPIDEVIWRYQTFEIPDSPQIEAGIFAMKQVDIAQMLSYFAPVGMGVDFVQMPPLSLYNFMICDNHIAPKGATMLTDVGADKTHLVIADGGRIWTRTINIGGNNFTQALMKSFKLSFSKAEKLKRTAAASKYARQIFQVMRPVFAELVQEIQRSVGHYKTIHRESDFKQLIGIGNGFRLPGMQKYLEQNLDMKVSRVTQFNLIQGASQDFQDRILSFGVAYGLALQGLGHAPVNSNLLPQKILSQRLWTKKKPWFIASAAALVLAAGMFMFRSYADFNKLDAPAQQKNHDEAQKHVAQMEKWKSDDAKQGNSFDRNVKEIKKNYVLRAYSGTWPRINSVISKAVLDTTIGPDSRDRRYMDVFATADPANQKVMIDSVQLPQAMLGMIDMLPYGVPETNELPEGDTPKTSLRDELLKKLKKIPRSNRRIIVMLAQKAEYSSNLESGTEDKDDARKGPALMGRSGRSQKKTNRSKSKKAVPRGFVITMIGKTPMDFTRTNSLLGDLIDDLKTRINGDENLKVVGDITFDMLNAAELKTVISGGAIESSKNPARRGGREPMVRAGGLPGMSMDRRGGEKLEVEKQVVDPDELFPDETTTGDTGFKLTIRVHVTGDGVMKEEEKEESEKSSRRRR
ncbi:MAG: pilus assembly protein PilM [Phycisphaerae bacterium]|nr:pilus assembly protein PilM [Phycisphaerae bacterium]